MTIADDMARNLPTFAFVYPVLSSQSQVGQPQYNPVKVHLGHFFTSPLHKTTSFFLVSQLPLSVQIDLGVHV
jgi:hypothetical protein